MRFGVAIPITVNLPFAQIANAALREHGDGTGDIPLTLAGKVRSSYLILWPHARPWHFSPPQPMLRAIPDAAKVARTLASALSAAAAESARAATATGVRTDDSQTQEGRETSPGSVAPQGSSQPTDPTQTHAGNSTH